LDTPEVIGSGDLSPSCEGTLRVTRKGTLRVACEGTLRVACEGTLRVARDGTLRVAGSRGRTPGLLFLVLGLFFPVLAFAQSAPIEALNTALAQAEKTGTQPFRSRYDALAPAIDHAFNLPQILQTIVGLRWSQIPADQQAKLLAVFRAFTIASYVANFNAGTDSFKLLPDTRSVGTDKIVETEIVPPQGDPTRIDYVMRNTGGAWQAVDVLQQGTISQAAVQRSDFRALLNDGGAAKLIASLQQKVDTLSGGAVKP
jgi:phospholipid transport system substrate-binding protein